MQEGIYSFQQVKHVKTARQDAISQDSNFSRNLSESIFSSDVLIRLEMFLLLLRLPQDPPSSRVLKTCENRLFSNMKSPKVRFHANWPIILVIYRHCL